MSQHIGVARELDSNSAIHPAYRPDIDGLRALAVGLVVAYHYFPNYMPGGFIGVDIFFVISGYLISQIILAKFETGGWSYRSFYVRRINRIFPALLVVLFFNLLLGWYALLPEELSALGKHIAASSAFLANVALWNEAGYFDNEAAVKPLLHLWSLAVEEQFYIAWPLLLALGAWLGTRNRFLWLLASVSVVSFAYSAQAAILDPTAAYYSPVSRFWQLAAGGLLAYMERQGFGQYLRARGEMLAALGAVLFVAAILLIDKNRAFPGAWALLPTLGAVALIAAGPSTRVNRYVFAWRPMVWVGLISYPLYLWHWTLLVWTKLILMVSGLSASYRLGLIALSGLLAWITYTYVEKYVKRHNSMRSAVVLCVIMALFGVAGGIFWSGAVGGRLPGMGLEPVVAATKDWDYPPRSFAPHTRFPDYTFYAKAGSGAGTTLYIGDSNMEQYAPRIEYLIDRTAGAPSAIFATKGGCLFSVPVLALRTYDCKSKLATVDALLRSDDVTRVVFSQSWGSVDFDDEEIRASFEQRLASIPKGRRVFIVLNMPAGRQFSPTSLLSGTRMSSLMYRPDAVGAVSELVANKPFRQTNAKLREIAARHDAVVVDPFESLCVGGECPVIDATGRPLYKDGSHLSASFARQSAVFMDITLGGAAGLAE